MKKIILVLLAFTVIVFTQGCDSLKKSSAPESAKTEVSSGVDISTVKGFDISNFDIQTDDQVFMGYYHNIVSTEDGYYFFDGNDVLYFFDRSSKQTVPLCVKPDCKHTLKDVGCNAYLDGLQYYQNNGLFYYENSLYILGNNGMTENNGKYDQALYLYKISKDGSKREQVCYFAEFGSDFQDMNVRFIIHKGIAYMSYVTEDKATLCCFDISQKRPESIIIDEISGVGAEIYRLVGCDDGVSYQYGYFTDEDLNCFEGGIKICRGGVSAVAVKGAVKPYIITNGKVYYETSNGVKIYSLSNGETKDFKTEFGNYSLGFDGTYFYAYDISKDESHTVYIYDLNGKFIDKFLTPDEYLEDIYFGDSEFLFCRAFSNNSGMYYFEKSEIGTGNIKWNKVDYGN